MNRMDDYIDRQAALNAINIERENMTRRQEWGAEHILTHYGYRIIADMPSADVAPVRHGRWVGYPECLKYTNAYSDDHIVCSVCEECYSIMDNDCERFNYCPNCGARMDGEEDV